MKAPQLGAEKPGRCWDPGTSTGDRERSNRRKNLVGFKDGATPRGLTPKIACLIIPAGVRKSQSFATAIYN